MLSYNVRDLEHQAATVDGELAADDPVWVDGDPRPDGPVRVTGRLSSAGPGRYYWNGHIEGAALMDCRRCLEPVAVSVADDVHAIFAESGDEVADDPDAYALPVRAPVVDLRPAVREQWLLSAPAFAVCRDDCKGLCPKCGTELNAGACDCAPETDLRMSALRDLRVAPE